MVVLDDVDRRSLVSLPRFVLVLFVAFSAGVLDLYLLHVVGIDTVSELLTRTLVHTVGLYLGLTVAAQW